MQYMEGICMTLTCIFAQKVHTTICDILLKELPFKGCVLCSPGCFSLFRAEAVMDENVMRTYTTLPTEPRHHVQYDQGEDRYLSMAVEDKFNSNEAKRTKHNQVPRKLNKLKHEISGGFAH